MLDLDLTTVDLVCREDETTFHARNPFPVGGVVEDPATGAAAAAFGDYLRERERHPARDGHRPPGRRHGPPEPAHRRHRQRARGDPRQRPGGGDVSER